jgi:hypothetical protein
VRYIVLNDQSDSVFGPESLSIPLLERTIRESVSFGKPFFVEGIDREQPAGTYTIETNEELIEGLSFVAYHRVSTSIALPLAGAGAGSHQVVPIGPAVVQAARAPPQDSQAASTER